MMKIFTHKWFWFILAIPLVTVSTVFAFLNYREPAIQAGTMVTAELADYGSAADFSMVERSGSRVKLTDLKGSPWIASFMFTKCAGQCPTMNFKITGLQDDLPGNVKMISFSVDPDYDTPEVLSRYAKQFNPKEGQWYFLTGEKSIVDGLLKSFHVNSSDDPMLHSLRLVLIDAESRIRGYYDTSDDASLKKLLGDLKTLKGGV